MLVGRGGRNAVFQFGQFVGDKERRRQQQPGFRHHAKRGRRLVAFAVDHRGKPKQVLLLAVAAGHHMAALADPERDLAHQCSLPFSSRSIPATAASARVRRNWCAASSVSCASRDRKSVVTGKSVAVRVVLGGRRISKKKKKK